MINICEKNFHFIKIYFVNLPKYFFVFCRGCIQPLIFLFICLIITNSCDNFNSTKNPQRQGYSEPIFDNTSGKADGVRHLFTISNDSSVVLSRVEEMVVDAINPFQLYVLDKGSYQVKLFDKNGKEKKTGGARGRGAGEFENPIQLGILKETLFVTEQNSPRAHAFNRELEYQNDYFLEIIPISLAPFSDSLLVLCGVYLGKGMNNKQPDKAFGVDVGTFSPFSLKFLNWLQPDFPLPEPVKNYPSKANNYTNFLWEAATIAAKADTVWAVLYYQNKVFCFTENEVLWERSIKNLPEYDAGDSRTGMLLPVKKIFRDITVDQSGNSYILTGSYGNEANRTIIVLDREGNQDRNVTLPFSAFKIVYAHPDRIYAIGIDQESIHCYVLIYD